MNGKKIGRPKQPERRQFSITVSEEMYSQLEKSAMRLGKSIAETVRLKIFGEAEITSEVSNLVSPAPLEMPTARTQEELDRNVNIRAGEFAAWVLEYRQDFADAQKVKRRRERGEPTTLAEEILNPRESD